MKTDPTQVAQDVLRAAERIRPLVRETATLRAPDLETAGGAEVYLKLENLQETGSFKVRGAANKMLDLTSDQLRQGVVTASSGNHGAAVAFAARRLHTEAEVFVPEGASPAKLEKIRKLGASIRVVGAECSTTEAEARSFADRQGLAYISPYNDLQVVAGQGTVAFELESQTPPLDAVFVSVGGGGLIAGIGCYLKQAWPQVKIIACSPSRSAAMHASLEAGELVEVQHLDTLSDGTAGGLEAGAVTFDLCRQVVDHSLEIPEDEIAAAIRHVHSEHSMVIEGAAGVAVAGWLQHREALDVERVGIVLCGSNISPEVLASVCGASGTP